MGCAFPLHTKCTVYANESLSALQPEVRVCRLNGSGEMPPHALVIACYSVFLGPVWEPVMFQGGVPGNGRSVALHPFPVPVSGPTAPHH